MTNAELIDSLRNVYGEKADCYHCHSNMGCYGTACMEYLCHDAADALEAADNRIAVLEAQEPTEKQVVDYCHKRCLVIVEEELFHRMKSTFSQLPKEGEWIDEQRGRWIYAKCNLCGKVQDVRSNYCPNCGAKMDGERKDG